MATKTVRITLTVVGVNIAPKFDIYDDVDPLTVRCANVDTTDLQAGYDCSNIDENATQVILVNIGGVCDDPYTIPIVECTTTTTSSTSSTTTTTTTIPPTTTTTTTVEPTTTTTTTSWCSGDLYNCYYYDLTCTGGEATSTTFTVVDCETGDVGVIDVYDGSPQVDLCYRVDPVYLSGSESYIVTKKTVCGEYCETTTTTTTII